jgi:hypothetical protein
MVGTHAFVQVEGGARVLLAEVGITAGGLLPQLRELEARGGLQGLRTAVVLVGTNDVGGSSSPEAIFQSLQALWQIAQHHGARVVALTVPPFKGWANYASRYETIEAKRKALNALILASSLPERVIRLDGLSSGVTDPADPERLLPSYDSGDHLHLKKDRLGALIQAEASGLPPSPPKPPNPKEEVSSASTNLVPYLVLGGIVLGGVVVLARKRGLGSHRFAKT